LRGGLLSRTFTSYGVPLFWSESAGTVSRFCRFCAGGNPDRLQRHRQAESLAVAAAQQFQSLYNSGLCSQLYDEAGRYFQAHETRRRWLRDCDQLRKRFGFWSQFTPTSSAVWPVGQVGIVWVRGPARFESGPAEVRLDWDLTNDHAALFNVLIEAGGEQISVPGFTGELRD
jgi:hypothetical protein